MLSAVLQAQKKGRGRGGAGEGRGGEEERGGGEEERGGGEEERGGGEEERGCERSGREERIQGKTQKRIGCIVCCSQHPRHWQCLWPVHLPPPHLLLADDNAPIHHNVIE